GVAGKRSGHAGIEAAKQLGPALRRSIQRKAPGESVGIHAAVEIALTGSAVQTHEHRKVRNVARYVGSHTSGAKGGEQASGTIDGPVIIQGRSRGNDDRRRNRLVFGLEIGRALSIPV